MALTLADFRSELRINLGNRTELASSDTEVDRWINRAQTRIVRRMRFDEMAVTESFTPTFADVPATDKVIAFSSFTNSNPRTIISIRVIDGTASDKLTFVPVRRWDRFLPKTDAFGTRRPSHYTVYDKQVELYRVPNEQYTYEIRFAKWPTALTTAGQNSDLLEKDDAIMAAATYYGFSSRGFTQESVKWLGEFATLMDELVLEERDVPDYEGKPVEELGAVADYWIDPFIRGAP